MKCFLPFILIDYDVYRHTMQCLVSKQAYCNNGTDHRKYSVLEDKMSEKKILSFSESCKILENNPNRKYK
jgi:hypothetical protein